jgi:hypothetical protein
VSDLKLYLPVGSDSSVYIDYDSDFDEFDQDVVNVRLPNGVYIEAGWFPENDPDGSFLIRVFAGGDEINESTADDVTQLKSTIESLAYIYSQAFVMSAKSGSVERTL